MPASSTLVCFIAHLVLPPTGHLDVLGVLLVAANGAARVTSDTSSLGQTLDLLLLLIVAQSVVQADVHVGSKVGRLLIRLFIAVSITIFFKGDQGGKPGQSHGDGPRKTLPGQIGRAFRLVLGRKPTNKERRSMREYVTAMIEHHNNHQPQPTTYPTKVVRSLVEEFSGDTFEFDELLPVFEDYVPDAKPATVSAETRAMADMCLLLLNANEFVYVY